MKNPTQRSILAKKMTYNVGIFVSFLKKMRMLLYKFFEIFEILAIILISFTKNPGGIFLKIGVGGVL